MTLTQVWAIAATAAASVAAVSALRTRATLWRLRRKQSHYARPEADPNRYLVLFKLGGSTHQLYHGYDALKARHAYEEAPMEAGMTVEFWEWGQKRGSKSA